MKRPLANWRRWRHPHRPGAPPSECSYITSRGACAPRHFTANCHLDCQHLKTGINDYTSATELTMAGIVHHTLSESPWNIVSDQTLWRNLELSIHLFLQVAIFWHIIAVTALLLLVVVIVWARLSLYCLVDKHRCLVSFMVLRTFYARLTHLHDGKGSYIDWKKKKKRLGDHDSWLSGTDIISSGQFDRDNSLHSSWVSCTFELLWCRIVFICKGKWVQHVNNCVGFIINSN